jgi:hypothetical protein
MPMRLDWLTTIENNPLTNDENTRPCTPHNTRTRAIAQRKNNPLDKPDFKTD